MAESAYLHIGLPKTGTTFIQQTLWRNHQRLAAAGTHLPLGTRRAHFLAAADLLGKPTWANELDAGTWAWSAFAEATGKISGRAMMSEEMLTDADHSHIKRVLRSLAPADIHVVITARDLARQVPSAWQQTIKERGRLTLAEFLERLTSERDPVRFWMRQDLPRIVHRWREHLPPGNVHLVTVPPVGQGPAALWARFAAATGIGVEVRPVGNRPNQSLGPPEIEALRRFNANLGENLPFPHPYLQAVRQRIAIDLAGGSSTPTSIPADWHGWIDARSRQMLTELAELQLDVVGELDDLLPVFGGQSEFSEREVADAAIQALIVGAVRAQAEKGRLTASPTGPGTASRHASSVRRRAWLRQWRWPAWTQRRGGRSVRTDR